VSPLSLWSSKFGADLPSSITGLLSCRVPGLELAYVRGEVLRRPADAARLPDHRRGGARDHAAEPVHGGGRDRDAPADRLLPRGRLLHLPDVARAPRRDLDLVEARDRRLLRLGAADRRRHRALLLARLAGLRGARVHRRRWLCGLRYVACVAR